MLFLARHDCHVVVVSIDSAVARSDVALSYTMLCAVIPFALRPITQRFLPLPEPLPLPPGPIPPPLAGGTLGRVTPRFLARFCMRM